jgi:beta-lactamase class A
MGKGALLKSARLALGGMLLFAQSAAAAGLSWQERLHAQVQRLDAAHPAQVGLYVKDLSTGEDFSYRGDERWYIASGVKVPVALEVLHQVSEGKLSLNDKIELHDDDRMDSAGPTNSHPAGTRLTVRYLLDQMLIYSDNTASDLLIRAVGLKAVNDFLQEQVSGFAPITLLADVRRNAYGAFDKRAFQLKNPDFIRLKRVADQKKRVALLGRLLGVAPAQMRVASLDDAYNAYYATSLNSATLRAYGELLEKVVQGEVLDAPRTRLLLEVMKRVETGKGRVKAGFPKSFIFAHKTGTQFARFCDFGVAWNGAPGKAGKKVVIAACTRGVHAEKLAEAALKALGKAVYSSGVFAP